MPPLAATAIRGALDPQNRGGPPGSSLLNRLSPAPPGNSPSRIPQPGGRGGGPGGHQRTNGISVRGAAVPGGRGGGPRRKYVKNERCVFFLCRRWEVKRMPTCFLGGGKRVELAGRAADDFVAIFYSNMDAAAGRPELVKLYRPASTLIWNGNKIQGLDALNDFYSKVPPSRHDVMAYDCHAIPGTEGNNDRKPSLLLTVSGHVTHGKVAIDYQAPKTPDNIEGLPRMFSQTFVLCPDLEGSGLPPEQWPMVDRYYILSDHLRFVG